MDAGEVEFSDRLTGNSSNTFRAPSKFEGPPLLANRRKPSGNRVAVRKYREKKRAQNAYLEEEVKKLRVVNKVLIRKLKQQAVLEAEAVRLRRWLLDLKAKLDKEKGVLPFHKKNVNGSSNEGSDRDREMQFANVFGADRFNA